MLLLATSLSCTHKLRKSDKKKKLDETEKTSQTKVVKNDTIPQKTVINDTLLNDSSINAQNINDTLNIKTTEDSIKVSVKKKKAQKIEEPIDYSAADSIWFDIKNKMVYLYGTAEVLYQDIELKADYIELDLDHNIVYAIGTKDSLGETKGSPHFKQGTEEFNSREIEYNFKTKKGLIRGVVTEQGGGFLHSELTKRLANNEICIKNGMFTTCNNKEHPHFYINLTKAKVIPNEKIISGPAYLVIEDVPVPLGIPFGFFPDQKKQASGVLIPEYGEEQNRGFFLKNGGYYFHINDYVNLQLRGDIYSRGTWGTSLASSYKKRYKFNGNIDLRYQVLKVLDTDDPQKTFWFKWNHNQDPKARPSSKFTANVNMGSSTFNKYNSLQTQNHLKNTMQSSVSYSKRWKNFNYSANLRHSQNSIDSTMTMSLPEMAFSMNRQYPFKKKKKAGKTKFYEKIGISYSSNLKNNVTIHEDSLFNPVFFKNMRNGIKHSIPISMSIKAFKFFTFNPSASYTERWYLNSVNKYWGDTSNKVITERKDGFVRSGDYLFTAPLSTKLYGFFSFKRGPIKAVRHVISPSLSYSYRPDFGQAKYGYYHDYVYDTLGNTRQYSIFESGVYGSPPSGKYGSVNLSLGNNLEMKVKNDKDTVTGYKKVKILESLSFRSSYNLAADSLNLSKISIAGRTNLLKIINISFSGSIDPYALNPEGKIINKFEWNETGKIGRFTSGNLTTGFRFQPKRKNKDKLEPEYFKASLVAAGIPDNYLTEYVDFNIPWSLNINYTYRYSKPSLEEKITQTLSFSGDINLTEKWKIGIRSGYDLEKKDITYTSIDIYRDLHCWEMSFNWIPFGFYKSYNFTINVKSAVLQDLKLNKRKNYTDFM